jgi:fatty-acyl-CoA synthase
MTLPSYSPFRTLNADILGQRARVSPERIALIDAESGARYTYAQMNARALRCAAALIQSCGLEKGARVAILSGNRIEFLDLFAAVAKTGAVLVALNTRYTAKELDFILNDAGVSALFYDHTCSATVAELRRNARAMCFIAFDEPADGDLSYSELCESADASSLTMSPCVPEDLCCLLYTSGTTGKPKGVMIPHRMVAFNAYNTAVSWQLHETDVSPIFTPLYHAGGLFVFLTPLWAVGGKIVLHREFNAAHVWRTIESEHVTVALGVPTIFRMLLDSPERPAQRPASLRWLISGGAPLPDSLAREYHRRGMVLKQGFGMTEVGVNCFMASEEDAVAKLGSIGRPLLFTQAKIASTDGSPLPPGEVGELLLRGPHVCAGYWNSEAATREAIDAEGWFHTGDLATQDAEGFFYIAGRSKDMFISGGVNVYPTEIELELHTHPQVKEAAVVGIPDSTWGEVGAAFVVPRSLEDPPQDLGDFLAGRIAKFKIPKCFHFVAELPRTPYGKVVKGSLASLHNKSHSNHGNPGGG